MTPMPLSFRRLLRWFIPELKNEDLDRLDSLLALRHHLVLEKNIVSGGNPERRQAIDPIREATIQANAILAPYKERYKAALSFWTARRELALRQDKFVPTLTNLRFKDLQLIGRYSLNYGVLLAYKLPFVAKVRKRFVSKTQKPSSKK